VQADARGPYHSSGSRNQVITASIGVAQITLAIRMKHISKKRFFPVFIACLLCLPAIKIGKNHAGPL